MLKRLRAILKNLTETIGIVLIWRSVINIHGTDSPKTVLGLIGQCFKTGFRQTALFAKNPNVNTLPHSQVIHIVHKGTLINPTAHKSYRPRGKRVMVVGTSVSSRGLGQGGYRCPRDLEPDARAAEAEPIREGCAPTERDREDRLRAGTERTCQPVTVRASPILFRDR